ncbi:hypothetical protein ERX35_009760 [Macrococcus equipercicus]|uniref:Uncharacterized protein n=1 Tax=Macrococcus equipercicus TaxID=69967 RepID=A0ABQ6R6N2_9STAP|nr:hypothetical protein [Macrococcus equipercicus]KAA1036936.1 hypothetical protein ERX35_009760 [Macrococcus equipercicus]
MANLFNQYTDLKKNQTPWPTKDAASKSNNESKFDIARKNMKKAAAKAAGTEDQSNESINR